MEKKYDLIFLDPPFKENTFINILRLLKEKKIYKKSYCRSSEKKFN